MIGGDEAAKPGKIEIGRERTHAALNEWDDLIDCLSVSLAVEWD